MAPTAIDRFDRLPELADERWIDCPSREHLLLAILTDIRVIAALRGCGVSEEALAEALRAHIDARKNGTTGSPLNSLLSWKRPKPAIDPGVERVVSRCIIRARASNRPLVRSSDILVSLLDDEDCAAGDVIRAQGVARYDVLNYVSHRISKAASPAPPPKPASPWAVCGVTLHNDDYTPMEFVVEVLERVFDTTREDAVRSMLEIHQQGSAECGVFAYDAALAKVTAVTDLGRNHQHALRCVLVVKTTEREGAHAELLT